MFGRLKSWLSGRQKRERHFLNAAGDFYVENNMCVACMAPEHAAPELMGHCENDLGHCYFKRQPETAEELEKAIQAIAVSCCGAVRYGGTDKRITARLLDLGLDDSCDHCS
jgi:hypothetical protein